MRQRREKSDIIPQPVDADDGSDCSRRRKHVSTIETSPKRSLLHQAGNSGYMGCCTLRNGMPLHELATQSKLTRDDNTAACNIGNVETIRERTFSSQMGLLRP
ncbi:hypothetical protein NQ317_015850 [Molorchus minor]|uniref:Uncharacterized protein n=1 Tax=Molorchus minor TaxID=1323400 RepID=A0ABQ9ITF6_9CUCU|nr:hypothetical protein NQ317_015850 [Molorchus minor]